MVIWKGPDATSPYRRPTWTQKQNGSHWKGTETLITSCHGTVAQQKNIEMGFASPALAGFPNSLIGNGHLVKMI